MSGYEPGVLKPVELPAVIAVGDSRIELDRGRVVDAVCSPAHSSPVTAFAVVGPDGFGPSFSECRTDVLPLDDGPVMRVRVLRFELRFRAPEARVLPGWTIL